MPYSVSHNCKKFKANSLEELFFQTCNDWLSILKTLKIQNSLDLILKGSETSLEVTVIFKWRASFFLTFEFFQLTL